MLKKFSQAMDEVKFFFGNFQILGPLGCQGWVVLPQNVKKPKSLHPSVYTKEAFAAPGGVYITGA
jgi:hypothetical protein